MVRVIAHRGFSGQYPENTLLSFRKAAELGVDEIEFDLKMTRDGHLVAMHDWTVDRTTSGHGPVSELTLKEVKQLDAGSWFSEEFAGERVPTFEEILSLIPEEITLNIHLHDEKQTECLQRVLKILPSGRAAYLAIDYRLVALARSLRPELTICNMGFHHDPKAYVEATKMLNCQRLQFFTPAYPVTAELVALAHSYGIFVNVFFASTEEEMSKYISYRVDAILTDFPDRLLMLRQKQPKQSG
ncbi:MAG TPA: glycerophosphodiester phosphodiesterase family protein [bacterium]|nr:glycerophosphodiester phosphodiesterase family protein [bacterium]HOL68152.1 glycerophosphodiester phosphodiesterase family protein [bacterium]HPP11473.1 glycerophosphodiester phosphodiesterase family protein [bacterium]